MARFIKIKSINQGIYIDMILNIDDIGHISIGPNMIFMKTRFADNSNYICVTSETIEKLEKVLDVKEVID